MRIPNNGPMLEVIGSTEDFNGLGLKVQSRIFLGFRVCQTACGLGCFGLPNSLGFLVCQTASWLVF